MTYAHMPIVRLRLAVRCTELLLDAVQALGKTRFIHPMDNRDRTALCRCNARLRFAGPQRPALWAERGAAGAAEEAWPRAWALVELGLARASPVGSHQLLLLPVPGDRRAHHAHGALCGAPTTKPATTTRVIPQACYSVQWVHCPAPLHRRCCGRLCRWLSWCRLTRHGRASAGDPGVVHLRRDRHPCRPGVAAHPPVARQRRGARRQLLRLLTALEHL